MRANVLAVFDHVEDSQKQKRLVRRLAKAGRTTGGGIEASQLAQPVESECLAVPGSWFFVHG
ncbi:MAG: hypothetical protein WD490_07175 [Opitutales bacterium]